MTIAEIKNIQVSDGWIDFVGTIKKVGETKTRTKSQMSKTPGQQYTVIKLFIQDGTAEIGGWAYYSQQFFEKQAVKIHGQYKLYQGNSYFDYADVTMFVAPPSPPPGPPQPAQNNTVQNPPSRGQFVTFQPNQLNTERLSTERQACVKAACEYGAQNGLDRISVMEVAIAAHYFVTTGRNYYTDPDGTGDQSGVPETVVETRPDDTNIPDWEQG